MDSKSMEIKVMYCEDVKAFNFFQKLLVYTLVSIVSDDPERKLKQNQQQRTPTDTEGDGNPEWNHEIQFDLSEFSFADCNHLFIHFDLRHEGLYFGDKTIGEVHVPLKDLIQESSGILRFLSYQVISPDGKPNGVINFSCKVYVKGKDMGFQLPASEISGYSVVVHHTHHSTEIHYPTPEVQSSSPTVHYPSLDMEDNYQEMTYPAAHVTEYSSQESHYPPPPNAHYPLTPSLPHPPIHYLAPPLPPPPIHHPAPLPLPQGACYHPPYPPGFCSGAPGGVYGYGINANWSLSRDEQSQSFADGERWRNEFRSYQNSR